jgi:hypothetical protein
MDYAFELNFLKTMISGFKRILPFLDPGIFGKLNFNHVFTGEASATEARLLNLQGQMKLIYIVAFKEGFPTSPTPEQQRNINEVWIAMGHPENVINV